MVRIALLVLFLTIPVEGRQRTASVAASNEFWVPAVATSWEQVLCAQVTSKGAVVVIQTGDTETPYVLVTRVVADMVVISPIPYSLSTTKSAHVASQVIGSSQWSRTASTPDGVFVILTK